MDSAASRISVIFLIVVIAVLARLPGLDKSFQGDEYFSILDAKNLQNIPNALLGDTHPPLYFYMLNFWMRISQDEAFLRLLSVIPGIGICWLAYLIGRRAFDTSVGIVSALIAAVAPITVWASQYIRTYSLACFFTVLSVYFLVEMLDDEGKGSGIWVGYVIASAAAIYTFYFSALIIIAENIFVALFLRHNKSFVKRWVISQAAILALYIPWVPYFIYQRGSYVAHPQMVERIGFYLGDVHVGAVMRSFLGLAGFDPKFFAKNIISGSVILISGSILFVLITSACIVFLAIQQFRSPEAAPKRKQYLFLFLLLAVVPFAIALMLHQGAKIILMSHYFTSSFVFLCIFLSAVYRYAAIRKTGIFVLIGLMAVYGARLSYLYKDRGTDFKSARSYLLTIVTKDTTILSPTLAAAGAVFEHYFSDIGTMRYVEDFRAVRLGSKDIVFTTCPDKLELKRYNESFHSFLKMSKYRRINSESFGDLLMERYSL